MNWYFLCVFCIWTMKICYLLFFRINKDINIILIQRLIINPRSGQPQQCVVKWPDNCSITPTLAALHCTPRTHLILCHQHQGPWRHELWRISCILSTKWSIYCHHLHYLILVEILAARPPYIQILQVKDQYQPSIFHMIFMRSTFMWIFKFYLKQFD